MSGPSGSIATAPPAPPTSRGPFRATAVALAVTAFGAGVPTPLYAVYESEYHFSAAVLAAVFAAYTLGVVITMVFVAPLSDAIGRRPILIVGLLLTAASGVAFVVAQGVATLALARVISGLSVGATTSTATAAMAGLEPRGDQHHVARVSVAANFGGVATGVLLSGLLVEYLPLPTTLVYLVLVGAGGLGAVLVVRTPETAETARPRPRVRIQRLRVPAAVALPFAVAAGALAGCYSIYGFFAALAPTVLRTEFMIGNRAAAAAVVAIMFGLAALVQLALARVRDRRALLLGLPIVAAGTVAILVAVATGSLLELGVGAAVLGTGVGCAYMGSVTLIDRVAPDARRGEILSAFFLVGYLALAVPTIGIGVAADAYGIGAAGFGFGVVLLLFSIALALAVRRTPTPAGGEGRPRGTP